MKSLLVQYQNCSLERKEFGGKNALTSFAETFKLSSENQTRVTEYFRTILGTLSLNQCPCLY